MHWHSVLTHFPISLFGATALFQILHVFRFSACFELASNVTLLFGVVCMGPALWSGWSAWRKRYRGAWTRVFKRKIALGLAMFVGGAAPAVWRVGLFGLTGVTGGAVHIIYGLGVVLLIGGAVLEGYYGSPLSHRR